MLTRAKACFPGLGCETVRESGSFDVTPGEGDWELDLVVAPVDATELVGTAVASLGGDIEYAYTVTGRYDARKDTSSLRLAPDAGGLGSSIRFKDVRMIPGALQGEIRYKILGHVGKTLATGVPSSSSFPSGGGVSIIVLPFFPAGTRAR
jgi:hypothetical protein